MVSKNNRHETGAPLITMPIYYLPGASDMDGIQDNGAGISVEGIQINNVRFADDNDMVEKSVERLKETVHILEKAGKNAGLKINAEKTKTMEFGIQDSNSNILIENIHKEHENLAYKKSMCHMSLQ